MKKYELLLVLPGTLDEKEAGKQVQEIKEAVSAASQDVELNNLGKVRLAYPIKQIRYGYYYTLVFNAEPVAVKMIAEKLRLRADVLRSMISHFNTNLTAAKKIVYSTNEVGVTTMMEKEEGEKVKTDFRPQTTDYGPQTTDYGLRTTATEVRPARQSLGAGGSPKSEVKVDLKAIDEKLNEILNNENIIPGV